MIAPRDFPCVVELSHMIGECEAAGLKGAWYVFGSVMRDEPLPADIDILCVVDSYATGRKISQAVQAHLLQNPIDLRILSHEDERKLDFIRRTASLPINIAAT